MCGGLWHTITCKQLTDGDWVTIQLKRSHTDHTSWVTPSGDVLLIDPAEGESTELVKADGTTEIGTLQLKYDSKA